VKIFGHMRRRLADGRDMPVPFGTYRIEAISPERYRLSGEGPAEPFELAADALTACMGNKMIVIEGPWPLSDDSSLHVV
jgi:hypothetical protein